MWRAFPSSSTGRCALGPTAFSHVEYAAAVTAWSLVVVRGGLEVIVYREAARRPRLIHSLTEILIGLRLACAVVGYAIVLLIASAIGRDARCRSCCSRTRARCLRRSWPTSAPAAGRLGSIARTGE